MPIKPFAEDLLNMGINAGIGALQGKANRKHSKEESLTNSVNAFKKNIAEMYAQDPGQFLRQALRANMTNMYRQNAGGAYANDPKYAKSNKLLDALSTPEFYGMKEGGAGGYQYGGPTFDYKPMVNQGIGDTKTASGYDFRSVGNMGAFGAASPANGVGAPAPPQPPQGVNPNDPLKMGWA